MSTAIYTVTRHTVTDAAGRPLYLGKVEAATARAAMQQAVERWGWVGLGGLVVEGPAAA